MRTLRSMNAGFDAAESNVELPAKCSLKFSALGGQLKRHGAASKLFGCETEFDPTNKAPVWFAGIGQILVPYDVRSY